MARSPTCKRVSDMRVSSFRIGDARAEAKCKLSTRCTNGHTLQMHAKHVVDTEKMLQCARTTTHQSHHLRESHRMEHTL
jgi:hypothetical protein